MVLLVRDAHCVQLGQCVGRLLQLRQSHERDLPRRRPDEIGTSHDMGDLLVEAGFTDLQFWQTLFRGGFFPAQRILSAAISAIDIALWDIKGKALNAPVYELLGGPVRKKARVYAHVYGKTIDHVIDCKVALADGTVRPTPQDPAEATLAPLLKKTDGRIDWHPACFGYVFGDEDRIWSPNPSQREYALDRPVAPLLRPHNSRACRRREPSCETDWPAAVRPDGLRLGDTGGRPLRPPVSRHLLLPVVVLGQQHVVRSAQEGQVLGTVLAPTAVRGAVMELEEEGLEVRIAT